MSFINKIPRGLRVLVVMAVLGVIIWQFAADTDYFYYGIGAGVFLAIGTILLVYNPFKSAKKQNAGNKDAGEKGSTETAETEETRPESDLIEVEKDYTDSPSILRAKSGSMSPVNPGRLTNPENRSTTSTLSNQTTNGLESETEVLSTDAKADSIAPAIPLVDDESSLTEEDKNTLVNAVWYRCENPYCKYTSFLGVHHIVDEKAGGTNRLDNLIVLCPYCHDLAHRNEIPEVEMREWISNRENRFRIKPNWKYF